MGISESVRSAILDRALTFKNVDTPVMLKEGHGILVNGIMKEVEKILQSDPFLPELYDKDYISIVAYELVNHINLNYLESDNKLLEIINEFLDHLMVKKSYSAIICLYGLSQLPIGTKIGNLEIINPNFDDIKFKKDLDILYGSYRNYINEQTELFDGFSWAKVTFEDYYYWNLRDVLFKSLELPFAMLSLIMGYDLDVKKTVGLIYYSGRPVGYLFPLMYMEEPQHPVKFISWMNHPGYNEESMSKPLNRLSIIIQKTNPNELEKRIIRATRLFGASKSSYKLEIRFLVLVSACESLLLSEKEKDYIAWKLSEKTAFLISENGTERLRLFERMKKLYNKRSKLVHEGKEDINYENVKELESVFYRLIIKLLELSAKYTCMPQNSGNLGDVDGVEDYINQLKFNTIKGI